MQKVSADNLYLTEAWFDNMVQSGLEDDASIVILSVEDFETESCYALLMLRSPAGQNGSRFAHWRMAANTIAGLTNFQSSFFNLIFDLDGSTLEEICQTLVKGLNSAAPKWHLVDLNLLDPDSREYSCLQVALESSGYVYRNYLYKGNWYEPLECSSFAEYVSTREKSSKKSIQNYQRKARKLDREGRLSIDVFSGGNCLDAVLEAYKQIYTSSWKEIDFFPAFYPELIRKTAENGSLRFVVVYLDGRPVAFEFAVITGLQCVMMRTAYIQEFARESVGAIAIFSMIEHVIEKDGVKEIDFGTDDDDYKRTWVTQRRERYGILCFNNNTIPGKYYLLRYMISEWIVSVVRQAKKIRTMVSKASD